MLTSTNETENTEMKFIPEIMEICTETICDHYRKQIQGSGIIYTDDQLKKAIDDNWGELSKQISKLYVMTYNELKKNA